MTKLDLTSPRFTQPEVLKVTGLAHGILQTWVNRGHIKLSNQNPGTGKRRLYSPLDVVKLAVITRLSHFNIPISFGIDLADWVADELKEKGTVDWNLYSVLGIDDAHYAAGIVTAPRSLRFNLQKLDTFHNRVFRLLEGPYGPMRMRRDRLDDDTLPVNSDRRDALARIGYHIEPILIMPIGEIVNGALLQLLDIEESDRIDPATGVPISELTRGDRYEEMRRQYDHKRSQSLRAAIRKAADRQRERRTQTDGAAAVDMRKQTNES